ncbi:MAG: pseudouridine synthase [Phycisphaerales bacterium]|nr:pseudouridine synthase [Phycisphaerales bacterium]
MPPQDDFQLPPPPPPPADPGAGWSSVAGDDEGNDGSAYREASRGQRLQKVMAAAGAASRRDCEELILSGEVHVNGTLVNWLPAWVDPQRDHIVVSGEGLRTNTPLVHVLLFKPRGVVCSNDDPGDRRRAIDLVKHPSKARLFPVGRLDIDSSGLLILTNDGELAARLTHPRHGIRKEYEVNVQGELTDREILRLQRGILLTTRRRSRRRQGGPEAVKRHAASSIELIHRDRDRTRLKIVLAEGRNRQIRRMMAKLDHPVKKLRRTKLGPLTLKGLKPGYWRELTTGEVDVLRRIGKD